MKDEKGSCEPEVGTPQFPTSGGSLTPSPLKDTQRPLQLDSRDRHSRVMKSHRATKAASFRREKNEDSRGVMKNRLASKAAHFSR